MDVTSFDAKAVQKEMCSLPNRDRLEGFRHLCLYCAVTVEKTETGQLLVGSRLAANSRSPQVVGLAVDLIESIRGQETRIGPSNLQDVHFGSGAPSDDSRIIDL